MKYISSYDFRITRKTATMLPPESVAQLKAFISLVRKTPQILHTPQLAFFKEFIESFGGAVPFTSEQPESSEQPTETPKSEPKVEEPEEDIESDVEIDNTGVIGINFYSLCLKNDMKFRDHYNRFMFTDVPDEVPEDNDPPIPTGEVSEESVDLANEKKREGISLLAEGNYEKAVETFTEAIKLHPGKNGVLFELIDDFLFLNCNIGFIGMALLYAKRGQSYLQLNKPNACIRDCTKALKINPDNAAAYKFRGRAHRLLGHWLEAVKDLRSACKIDFDEQTDEWLKEVTPNVSSVFICSINFKYLLSFRSRCLYDYEMT